MNKLDKIINVKYREKIYLFWVCYLLPALLTIALDPSHIKSNLIWHVVVFSSINVVIIGLSIFFTKKGW